MEDIANLKAQAFDLLTERDALLQRAREIGQRLDGLVARIRQQESD